MQLLAEVMLQWQALLSPQLLGCSACSSFATAANALYDMSTWRLWQGELDAAQAGSQAYLSCQLALDFQAIAGQLVCLGASLMNWERR